MVLFYVIIIMIFYAIRCKKQGLKTSKIEKLRMAIGPVCCHYYYYYYYYSCYYYFLR